MEGTICHIDVCADTISVRTKERGFVIIEIDDMEEGLRKGDKISGDFEICSDCNFQNHTTGTVFNGLVWNNYLSEGQAKKKIFPVIKHKTYLFDFEPEVRFILKRPSW